MTKKLKHYVSEVDQMLAKHKQLAESTLSEQEEISKHNRISKLQKINANDMDMSNINPNKSEGLNP